MSLSLFQVQYLEELDSALKCREIDESNICLVGSVCLAVRGLRKNEDLDVCFRSSNTDHNNKLESKNISIALNRYEHIGISDKELINNKKYYDILNGYKIIRPEIEYSHKKIRGWDKDQTDLKLLEEYRVDSDDWKAELVIENYTPGLEHLLRRGWASLRRDGLRKTIKHGIRYLRWHSPLRNNAKYSGQATSVPAKALRSYRQDGFKPTLIRGIRLAKLKEPTGLLDRYSRLRHKAKLATLAERKLDLHYPTPALLTEQYESDTFSRMDLVVRLLAAEAIVANKPLPTIVETFENETGESVHEDVAARLAEHDDAQARPTVPIDYDSSILDANALAAWVARRSSAPAVSVSSGTSVGGYDRSWFASREFSEAELEMIDARFTQLLYETGTLFPFILWPPAQDYADDIVDHLREEKQVHFTQEISFDEDAFETFVWELYESQADLNMNHIEAKIEAMDDYKKTVLVGAVEVPDPRIREGFSNEMIQMKERVREQFTPKILTENPSANLLIHATDNYEHSHETWNILEENWDEYPKGLKLESGCVDR